MNNFCIPNSCCPPETVAVETVQTVDGIKGLNNCFVKVIENNTLYYVDKAHRITVISSNVLEIEKYDADNNPKNLRNQFAYDPVSQDLFYFDNKGKAVAFSSVVSKYEVEKVLAKVLANTDKITTLETNLADEITNRETADTELKDEIDSLTADVENINDEVKSLQDQVVQIDTTISNDSSSVTITKLRSSLLGEEADKTPMLLPVASETEAGVMDSATYKAVQTNAEDIDTIINGAIALDSLPANPTQEELTVAWKVNTNRTTLVNHASIFDTANNKVWYYYTNINRWLSSASGSSEVTVSRATNNSLGIVKGDATTPGKVYVEADGSQSVNGWSGMQHDLQNLTELVNAHPIPKLPSTLVTTTANQRDLAFIGNTLTHSISLRVPNYNSTTETYDSSFTATIPNATTSNDGSMSYTDKSKLDKITNESIIRSNNLPIQVFYNTGPTDYNADDIEVHLIMKDLHTGGDAPMTFGINSAVPSGEGVTGKAGIMSVTQATQLAALASAYEAEEKGTVLYEGSASVNNIELSESGLSYDHLIVVAQYMGMGSFALEQQVSTVFYPTDNVKAFQMNTTDITTGNSPMVQLIQDIWSLTDDGMEIELVSALKATVNSETTVDVETTSNFTITKVVGFGKKLTTE